MKKSVIVLLFAGMILFFIGTKFTVNGAFFGQNSSINYVNLVGLFFIIGSMILLVQKDSLEAIIVPTGPTEKIGRERAVKGANRFHKNPSRYVIVSGQYDNGKYGGSQSQKIYEELINGGVSKDHIIFENRSRNTRENVAYTSNIINEKNIGKVIIATDKAHAGRFKMLFQKAKKEGTVPRGLLIRTDSKGISPSYNEMKARTAYIKDQYLPLKKTR